MEQNMKVYDQNLELITCLGVRTKDLELKSFFTTENTWKCIYFHTVAARSYYGYQKFDVVTVKYANGTIFHNISIPMDGYLHDFQLPLPSEKKIKIHVLENSDSIHTVKSSIPYFTKEECLNQSINIKGQTQTIQRNGSFDSWSMWKSSSYRSRNGNKWEIGSRKELNDYMMNHNLTDSACSLDKTGPWK
ncbi:hypothetical protein AC249_AIPGENE17214 [Exaiptasia diaphana]|nr:hypothetical protein AC249_AIPGENE17214 [Exaiptasia diaphana]